MIVLGYASSPDLKVKPEFYSKSIISFEVIHGPVTWPVYSQDPDLTTCSTVETSTIIYTQTDNKRNSPKP